MPCTCIDCNRKVAAGLKDPKAEPQVRWAPRMSADRALRQRDELRRSESPLRRPSSENRGRGRRGHAIRIKKRMRICVHTAAGSAHGRTMGGRCEVCKTPTPTSGRERQTDRGGAADRPRWSRGRPELTTPRGSESGPKRRRGAYSRAPVDRRAAHRPTSTADPGPAGSNVLAAMAACLVNQANVLAAMVPGVRLGPTGAVEVAAPGGRHPDGRAGPDRRGSPAATTVAHGTSRSNTRRRGRKGQGRRRPN
ncbi:uncharacterized protein [Drosophila bipectinata]|uniref:uncharacterized protein n=1 Tax=Drosophila bipectinata TaxID=42026 RepID=UPI0038B3F612